MIPNQFHLIWIGRQFPFVYRLAVESLVQTQSHSKIVVHFQDPPQGNQDWDALQKKVEFRPIDMTQLLAGLPPSIAATASVLEKISSAYPAGKSNVLRYLILYREGGIYLDFDTITLNSFAALLENHAFVGEEKVFRCDDDRVAGKWTWSYPFYGALFGLSYGLSYTNCRWLGGIKLIETMNAGLMHAWSANKLNNAVLGAEPKNPFFAQALELIPSTNASMRFALGPMLMNRTYSETNPDSIRRLPPPYFYAIPPSQTFRFFFGSPMKLPEEAIVLHWCSSNHRSLAPSLTRKALESAASPHLYGQLARKILEKGI